jgi:hypothetical protein
MDLILQLSDNYDQHRIWIDWAPLMGGYISQYFGNSFNRNGNFAYVSVYERIQNTQ